MFNLDLQNKDCIITYTLVIIAVVFLLWNVFPSFFRYEAFSAEEEQLVQPAELIKEPVKPDRPIINVAAGTIMDSAGAERADADGSPQGAPPMSIPSNYYFLDDGAGGEMTIMNNLCSKSCCSAQWPTPFKQKYDPYVCQNKDKFVPSNIFCNNTFQDAGCLCLTKDQGRFLYNRGQNGREWF